MVRRKCGTGNISHGYISMGINWKHVLLHRLIWEEHNGPIPENMIIHHINGNKQDNRIENLIMLDRDTHNKIHAGYKMIDGEWWKKCTACEIYKPINEFSRYKNKNEIVSRCKICNRKISKKYNKLKKAIS